MSQVEDDNAKEKFQILTMRAGGCFSCFACWTFVKQLWTQRSQEKSKSAEEIILECAPTIKNSSQTLAPLFSLQGFRGAAKIQHVYDGDTFCMTIKLSKKLVSFKCKLMGVHTPDMKSVDETEKDLAIRTRDRVRVLIQDKIVCVECYGGFNNQGQLPVRVALVDGADLSDKLVKEKLAFYYDGFKKRQDWDSLFLM